MTTTPPRNQNIESDRADSDDVARQQAVSSRPQQQPTPPARPATQQAPWVEFSQGLGSKLMDAGIELIEDRGTESGFPENKGWVRLEVRSGTSAGTKVYVPRAKTRLGHLETTIPLEPDPERGVLHLPTPRNGGNYTNGAIRSHLVADVETAAEIIIEAIQSGVQKPTKRVPMTQQRVQPSQETSQAVATNQMQDDESTEDREVQPVHQNTR